MCMSFSTRDMRSSKKSTLTEFVRSHISLLCVLMRLSALGKAIEFMVSDALVAANNHLRISDAIYDPSEYIKLTDCVLKEIEHSTAAQLKDARTIIRRLRTRDLYRYVDEYMLSESEILQFKNRTMVPMANCDVT